MQSWSVCVEAKQTTEVSDEQLEELSSVLEAGVAYWREGTVGVRFAVEAPTVWRAVEVGGIRARAAALHVGLGVLEIELASAMTFETLYRRLAEPVKVD